ncbi:hypothetical protein A2U01_0039911 [Trifolium medium]|uniref:Uncharacterized protein n=1 Tax=Trifolium medium TaxID=97028 RepID=A0A392Q5D4_9FABA|nr:hypothetical protein [Trifolium medium]
MCITGPWENAVNDLDYTQYPTSWRGLSSSNDVAYDEVLNPNVAHDLMILQ